MGEIDNIKDLLEIARSVSTWIKGDKYDSLRVECSRNLGVYSTTVDIESKFSKWVKKYGKISRRFNPEDVYNIKVIGIKPPSSGTIDEAVYMQDNEIILDLSKVLDYDRFRLEIAYKMNEDWLKGIVHSRSSPEPLKDALKYNLSAQLKDPNSLIKGFSEFEVDEFPVTARVQIQDDIDTNIPKYLKQMAQIEAEMLSDYDPHHAMKIISLQKRRAQVKKDMGKEDTMSKLKHLSLFLRPEKFINYVHSNPGGDFRLENCKWGDALFRAIGMVTLPEAMQVITRTDLTLKKPASSGELIYESMKFSKDVQKVFKK
jgi:hypothetical protein